MTTLLLVRHGRTDFNRKHALAGWTPGVGLDETGQSQAEVLAERLAGAPLAAVVTSPLDRCRQTVTPLAKLPGVPVPVVEERIGECRYGEWTGRAIAELALEPEWKTVQHYPSRAAFPGGERLAEVRDRAVAAIAEWDSRIASEHGDNAVWLACSHEDVIKTIVADTLGMHLDLFQRITVSHAAVTAIRFTGDRPYLLRLNDTGQGTTGLLPSVPETSQ